MLKLKTRFQSIEIVDFQAYHKNELSSQIKATINWIKYLDYKGTGYLYVKTF